MGNYWSDYKGTDQNGDGFGDTSTPHHKDRYPFIVPVGPIPFFLEGVRYDCIFLGNATLSMLDFDHDSKSIGFDICLASKNGYFNVTTPRKLLNGQFNVTIDGVAVASVLTWNKTHTSTYFELSIPPFSEYSICHVRIISRIATPLTGDVNIDGFVDIFDAVILAKAFGSKPRDSNWNATADVNIDGFVDIFDAVLIAKNFGKLPSACAR